MSAMKSLVLLAVLSAFACVADAETVVNIVNFVRASEPRLPMDLVTPLREEVKLNTQYHLPNTILLQYDALLDDELMSVAKSAEQDLTEYGVWIEAVRPLVEKVGLKWRGRADWAWDWHIVPGFLMAYTHEERKLLIDELFRLFREKFGRHPESVGSWLIDAWSMDYMVRTYGVKGFGICREQDNTDAYGLRGGYSNGLYYPSRKNMLSAAVDMENAVKAPVFRLLTPDPIFNYGGSIDSGVVNFGCPTIEPVWYSGSHPKVVDWYFRVYTDPRNVNLSYMQIGQENSFGWREIGKGLPYQIRKVAELREQGKITVEKMGDTAKRFLADHPENCVQTQIATENWTPRPVKSVWYNSRYYRANLILDHAALRFRDIHVMCDDYEEPFLDKVCDSWQALYYTPPVADEYLAGRGKGFDPLTFLGAFTDITVERRGKDELVVRCKAVTGDKVSVTFTERGIDVRGAEFTKPLPKPALSFEGFSYRFGLSDRTAAKDGFTMNFAGKSGPRLSVFHNHVADMAREKGVSIAEAVKAAKAWGIEGVDVFSAFDHGEAEKILAAGMEPSTYIMSADFAHTNDAEKVEKALAFVKRTGCPRIMLVAGYFNEGESRETAWQAMKPRIESLVSRAAEMKVKVELEDFDDRMQVVGSSEHLRRAFAEIPELGHVFDTGNYSYWKEDASAALREFRARIGHVHVKDVSPEGRSVASGTGVLPIRDLVVDLKNGGYSNWLTIECFGVTNVWDTIETSARFLRRAVSAE